MTELPHNPDAEQAVIGSLLIDPGAISQLAGNLLPDAFYVPANRTIYRAIVALWKAERPCDIVTLSDFLQAKGVLEGVGGSAYLGELVAAEKSPYNVLDYAGIVRGYAYRRAVIDAATETVRQAYAGELDVEAVVGSVRRSVEPFALPLEQSGTSYAETMGDHRAHIEERWRGGTVELFVPTGIRPVDRVLYGGMRPGDLTVIAATTGMGKTSLMLQMAHYAALATGKRSVVVELEMSAEAIRNRAIASEAGVPFGVAYGTVGDAAKRSAWLEASERLESLPVSVWTQARTTDRIRGECEQLAATEEIGVVLIDHLDWLEDPFKGDNIEQKTAMLARRCKRLGQSIGAPVVILMQLNRAVEAKSPYIPELRHIRNSGAVAQDADYVFMLYRRRYYVEKLMLPADESLDFLTASNQQKVDLIVAKNRNGEVCTVPLGWSAPTMSFHETTEVRAA